MVPMTPHPTSRGTTATPFDQIVEAEKEAELRLQKEKDALDTERRQTEQALAQKAQSAEEEMRTDARSELQQFKKNDVPAIIKEETQSAKNECDKLEKVSKKNADAVIEKLTKDILSPDFSLTA